MVRRISSRRPRAPATRTLVVNALALLIAVPALVYSLTTYSPAILAQSAQRMVADAATSLSAAVPPNPYNTLAAQLDEKQAQLDARAAQLSNEQASINAKGALVQDLGLAGFGLSVVVLLLVALNFYFDARRRSERPMGPLARKFLVDLR